MLSDATIGLIGSKLGGLIVEDIERRLFNGRMHTMAYCRCVCGRLPRWYRLAQVKRGQQSCGCLARKLIGDALRRHGMKKTKEYRAWVSMRQRCYNTRHKAYPGYGGRGIKVCESWQTSFEAFFSDMGRCPNAEASLERKENNGDYTPDNCVWIPKRQQTRNTRISRRIQHDGREMILSDWARELNVPPGTLASRIKRHGVDAAISHFARGVRTMRLLLDRAVLGDKATHGITGGL